MVKTYNRLERNFPIMDLNNGFNPNLLSGGGFSIGSAFHPGYHKYVSALVAKADIIAISIDYRLAPDSGMLRRLVGGA
jgi:hypothetical protein